MPERNSDGRFVKSPVGTNEAARDEVQALVPPQQDSLPSTRSVDYDPSDDGNVSRGYVPPVQDPAEHSELVALRQKVAEMEARLAAQGADVAARIEQVTGHPQVGQGQAQPGAVGPSGLPAGLYPERSSEVTQGREHVRGLLVHEVIEMDRLEAQAKALDNIAKGLPPVPQPLPPGTVTASPAEFVAQPIS